jgi:hypothetical protein
MPDTFLLTDLIKNNAYYLNPLFALKLLKRTFGLADFRTKKTISISLS